jgi:hypothetical protein
MVPAAKLMFPASLLLGATVLFGIVFSGRKFSGG